MKAKELKSMNETKAREAVEAEFSRLYRVRNINTEIGRVKLIAELRNLWRASGHEMTRFPLIGNTALEHKFGVDAARERGLKQR